MSHAIAVRTQLSLNVACFTVLSFGDGGALADLEQATAISVIAPRSCGGDGRLVGARVRHHCGVLAVIMIEAELP
jgi:hypothetical protein